jgi:hypothetical protein
MPRHTSPHDNLAEERVVLILPNQIVSALLLALDKLSNLF